VAKKMVKKKKLRIFRLLLIFLILGVFFLTIYFYFHMNIQNIIIKGNHYLSDDEVIQTAGITNYPSFASTFSPSMKKRLMHIPLIEKVEIKRSFYHVLMIQIQERQPLFRKLENGKVVLDNYKEVELDKVYSLPTLMNYVPNTKYKKFVLGMKKIHTDILGQVSEIEYQPNEHDKDRFLLYMNDGNSVYLTLTKFAMLNYYNDVITQLEGKKGILYLDSGNHFKIME